MYSEANPCLSAMASSSLFVGQSLVAFYPLRYDKLAALTRTVAWSEAGNAHAVDRILRGSKALFLNGHHVTTLDGWKQLWKIDSSSVEATVESGENGEPDLETLVLDGPLPRESVGVRRDVGSGGYHQWRLTPKYTEWQAGSF